MTVLLLMVKKKLFYPIMVEITCVIDAQELTLVCLCVHECVCVFAHACVDRVTQKEDEVSAVPAESSQSCHQMMLCGSAFIRELFVILFLNRLECEVVTGALLSPARPIISFTGTREPLCYISRPAGSVQCTPLCSPTFPSAFFCSRDDFLLQLC